MFKHGLIGSTGFVGKNILSQLECDARFRSTNIQEIEGKEFEILLCAAPSAEKWKANQSPETDLKSIQVLLNHLKEAKAEQFVLISTIDVYPDPVDVDEDTPINTDLQQPYGKHRYYLEQEIQDHFANSLIVRLPGLFGKGLKKNFIFDLFHPELRFVTQASWDHFTSVTPLTDDENRILENSYSKEKDPFELNASLPKDQIESLRNLLVTHRFTSMQFTNPNSQFQFYDLSGLWHDIQIALQARLKVVNFATEPIIAKDLARELLEMNLTHSTQAGPVKYQMKSRYAALFNKHYEMHQEHPIYFYSKPTLIQKIKQFKQEELDPL